MSRKPPTNMPPLKVNKQERSSFITETRCYKLITHLYGGGVEPNNADPITVVRATEIRGNLRFWWRATRGSKSGGDLNKLRRLEESVWGSAAETGKPGPSEVCIQIENVDRGKKIVKVKNHKGESVPVGDPSSPFGYVAFPLREEDGKAAGFVLTDVEFTLVITYPVKHAIDIQAALWAWETFGGIGARTRRGFGAVTCTHIDKKETIQPEKSQVVSHIKKGLKEHISPEDWPEGVPHLDIDLVFKVSLQGKTDDPIDVWKYLIGKLKSFRQARYGKRGFSLSKWPEANEIRRRFNKPYWLQEGVTEKDIPQKFPRAAFGLPIIFHMPHDKELPENITLQGVEKSQNDKFDRLASPLILRPLTCLDGAVGLAAILEGPRTPPGGLILKGAPNDPKVESKIEKYEVQHIPPLKNENEADVLKAFLKFLK